MKKKYVIIFISLFCISNSLFAQDSLSYQKISARILQSDDVKEKQNLSKTLYQSLKNTLSNSNTIEKIDSTGLLYELISSHNKFQIVTWAINMNESWKYYIILKTYNQIKKVYDLYDLVPTDFTKTIDNNSYSKQNNWPASVYFKLIENEYNGIEYYTFLGWVGPTERTAHKIIEVMTLSETGKPNFGQNDYFFEDQTSLKRKLFSYNRQSKFILDYGTYQYTEKKWDHKKRKYEVEEFIEDLIVFDHLVLQNPQIPKLPEFMVPSGNLIDAYKFEKGRWILVGDIDARNMKRKTIEKAPPRLNLINKSNTKVSN